ncbi:MAG: hypothetical protein ACRD5L_18575 [Bryobacteraceae bacterium]
MAPEEIPFPGVSFSSDIVHDHRGAVAGMAYAILKCAAEHPGTVDPDALAALAALAETFRTLGAGLYYEKPPAGGPPQALYGAMAKFLEEYQKQQGEQPGLPPLKNSDIFRLLVFLLRVGKQQSNGRPRSRLFLDFLRTQFPRMTQQQAEPSRIIVP